MPRMTGTQALVQLLRAEGASTIFGNPGTTESPLIDALDSARDIRYIVTLQEASALAMADGYARATGKPAFVQVHISVGVANADSMLYNAFKGGTPLVVTAGQVDTHLLLQDAVLSSDQAERTRYTKWSAEVLHPRELPMALRRAFKIAKTPPTGPTFLSLPWNVMDEADDLNDVVGSSPGYFRIQPDAEAVEKTAALLAKAEHPVMLIGDRIAQSAGMHEAVALAETLGATVYAGSFTEVNFPTSHPQYMGGVGVGWPNQAVRNALKDADVVLIVGSDVLPAYGYTREPFFGPKTKLIHLDNSQWDIEKKYPVEIGMTADPKAGMAELAAALDATMNGEEKESARSRAAALGQAKAQRKAAFQQRARTAWNNAPISPERMMGELAQVMPKDAIMCSEAITSGGALMGSMDFDAPGSYYSARGGALGWGMPGPLGVKLANPDRPVVAVVGDGSSMYTVQALWTAARYNIPVVYAICNNGSWRILREGMARYLTDSGRNPENALLNFKALPLDLAKVAEGFGVEGIRVDKPEDLRKAYERAFAAGKPVLVDVHIDDTMPTEALQSDYRPFNPYTISH
ncbi:MAG: thiamine pyrophosphate-binding protein [Chloroflexi bacterium]|nr:thiamine pyrophosphate-binding protein [Chloroflexota bacterium]